MSRASGGPEAQGILFAGPLFQAQEIAIAGATSALAVLGFVGLFQLPPPPPVRMDISDENRKPIAVQITPLLKLGGGKVSRAPSAWERKTPPPPRPKPAEAAPTPSPIGAKTPEQALKAPLPDAASPTAPLASSQPESAPRANEPAAAQTGTPAESDAAAGAANAPPGPGSPLGVKEGTETDPLKARAVDMYRRQLASFFVSRLDIKGKIPFDELKGLHAKAIVTVSGERRVASYAVSSPSGNSVFDDEVRGALERLKAGGVELPAPPALYPDVLGESVPVVFQCTNRSQCE